MNSQSKIRCIDKLKEKTDNLRLCYIDRIYFLVAMRCRKLEGRSWYKHCINTPFQKFVRNKRYNLSLESKESLNNVLDGTELLLTVLLMYSVRKHLNSVLNLFSSELSQERYNFILVSKRISEKAYFRPGMTELF